MDVLTVQKSYDILDSIRLPHGLYIASPSEHYSAVWIRDTLYISLPYLNKNCDTYEKALHRLLDLLLEYEWKIDIHTKERPRETWQYIHAKYDAFNVKEILEPWGHAQHDAVGLMLWSVGEGERRGKKIIRNDRDRDIVQKLVYYLETCEYWHDEDNGMWEEKREVHASSLGSVVSGLRAVRNLVTVPSELIMKGMEALQKLNGWETDNREVDMSQLSLIYPHKVYSREMAMDVLHRVEDKLLRARGVIRYEGDSYYSTKEAEGRYHALSHYFGTEGEWCMGLPWLALCYMELGDNETAQKYITLTEQVMLTDGSLPELYFANTNEPNPNTPLGWANAMYVVAKERIG
jgi:phosphorylase kinase alpha/beta subunit